MLFDGINLIQGSHVINLVLESGASLPSSPDVGELFFHTTTNQLVVFDGLIWSVVTTSDSASPVIVPSTVVPNAKSIKDARITQGSNVLNSASGLFSANDVGKHIKIYDGTNWIFGVRTTIATFVNSTQITLTDVSPITISTGKGLATWGTDNAAAINTALSNASALVTTLNIDVNNPIGGGIVTVSLPVTSAGDKYLFSSQLVVPRNVRLDCGGMLYNNVTNGSDGSFCIALQDGGHLGHLLLDCAHGSGFTSGSTSGDGHTELEHIRLWNVGTDTNQFGAQLQGFDYDIGFLWIKGGNISLDMNVVSDCLFKNVYIMGAQTPIRMNGCQNITFNKIALDTNATIGMMIDNSHHIEANLMAFNNFDGSGGVNMQVGLMIGQFTGTKVSNLNISYRAVQTGGVGMYIGNAEDCSINLELSNSLLFSNTNGSSSFTTGIQYDTGLSGFININATVPTNLPTYYSGTKYGNLTIKNNDNIILLPKSNLGIGTLTEFGSGVGVIGIGNASTISTTSPSNGFVLYSASGVPKFKFSDGTLLSLDAVASSASVISVTTTANTANTTANTALSTANTANTTGNSALTLATTANTTANLALNPGLSADNKKIIIFGSSTAAGVGSSDWHGTPNNGANPQSTTSWGGLFTAAMTAKGFTVVNQSIGGTYSQSSIDRFYSDVAPLKPKFVILATSIWNEPNLTTDPYGAIKQFLVNTHILCRMVESIDAIPILIGQYVNWAMTPTLYGIVKTLYPILERLAPLVLDLLNAIDNGSGNWISSLTTDYTHANDAGHICLFNTVPLTFFDQSGPFRTGTLSIPRGAWLLGASDATLQPMVATLDRTATSWSFRAKVQAVTAATGKAYLSIGVGTTGYFRVRNPSNALVLTDSVTNTDLVTSTVSLSDLQEHDILVTYNAVLNKAYLYIDGAAIGNATPSFSTTPIDTFVVGGKQDVGTSNAVSHIFSEVVIWRTCLSSEDALQLYTTKRPPLKSIDVLAPLSHFPTGTYAQNIAQTTTLVLAPGTWSQVSVSTSSLPLTGGTIGTTWNSSGTTYTALKINVTDTASAASSLLQDWQIGGSSKFALSKTGEFVATAAAIKFGLGGGSFTSNLGIGTNTLTANTTGTQGTAVGVNTLSANTTGLNNTAIGYNSLPANTTGSSSVSIGCNALLVNTTGFQNTAVGKDCLKSNIIGNQNTGIGNGSLMNSTGDYNSALGFQTLTACTSGINNTGFGGSSLSAVTTGSGNIGLGFQSGTGITTSSYNVIIGKYTGTLSTSNNVILADGQGNVKISSPLSGSILIGTLTEDTTSIFTVSSTTKGILPPRMTTTQRDAITSPTVGLTIFNNTTNKINVQGASAWEELLSVTGNIYLGLGGGSFTSNLGIGTNTLTANTTGTQGTAVGYNTLSANTTGLNNTAVGYGALSANTTGSSSVGIGCNALLVNTTGFQNTAVGKDCLKTNIIGNQNTGIGNSALLNATGNYNSALGFQTLTACTTGTNNTGFGGSSLSGVTTGSGNIGLGYQSGTGITTQSYNVVIGSFTGSFSSSNNIILADGQGNERFRIPSTGALLLGTTTDDTTSIFTVSSTTKGILPPRMTTTQRDAITSPTAGLVLYNSTTNRLTFRTGSGWDDLTSVSGNAGTATTLATSRNIDGQAFNGSADITVIAPGTHAATSKTTPVDADEVPLVDSAASNILKKLTWSNLKATLKTYFDTLYPANSTARIAIFTSSGTWTCPSGITTVYVDGAAGGGGGGGAASTTSGGGSGGQAVIGNILTVTPGTTYTITIGAGGAGGSAGDNDGSVGGNTTFDTLLTLIGGNYGRKGSISDGGASAGIGSAAGQKGIIGSGVGAALAGQGGGSIFGAAAYLIQVGVYATPIAGTNGNLYGGGGSGTVGSAAGGDGAPGFIKITW